jgi:NRAMP (natural resistance-associated macrophage protein)-like metal ion transporter
VKIEQQITEKGGDALDFRKKRRTNLFKLLGPGLITGAADDDPSGIATYSQVGAKFGFGMLWTMLVSYPMMIAVQEISARIGRITGRGLAGNMCRVYSAWITFPLVALLVAANVFNLGADIIAMGTALALVIGGPAIVYSVLFTIGSLAFQILIPYTKYSNYLKWLTIVLFSYVATVFVIHVPWGEALRNTLIPRMSWNKESLTAIVAVLGTTISPYLFFWQASTEVEEVETHEAEHPLKEAPEQAEEQFERIRLDTLIGMAASNIVAFFIILTAAVTLHAHGKTDINSAAEAAENL